MLPLPVELPRAVLRRHVITWTGMGFTSVDGVEEIKFDGPPRSDPSTEADMERSDSGTIFVGC